MARWARTFASWLVAASVLAAGCAALKNTPEPDIVWKAHAACQMEGRISNNVILTRVEPDGRYWIETRNGNAGLPAFVDCMNEKFRAAR